MKHTPFRTCVGCRRKFPQNDLVRIIRTKKGEIKIKTSQKQAGRSVYFCPKKECLEKILKSGKKDAISHGLKVKAGEEFYRELKKYFEKF